MRREIDTFKPYKRTVALVAIAIVLTSGLGVINPLLIAEIFNNALFGEQGAGEVLLQPSPAVLARGLDDRRADRHQLDRHRADLLGEPGRTSR